MTQTSELQGSVKRILPEAVFRISLDSLSSGGQKLG